MEPLTEEQDRQRRFAACDKLRGTGFYPIGGWLFMKNGVAYDLSATNLDIIDQLEREGKLTVATRLPWHPIV